MAPSTILAANKAYRLEGWGAVVGCRLPPLDGYVSVCLVLIKVYVEVELISKLMLKTTKLDLAHSSFQKTES